MAKLIIAEDSSFMLRLLQTTIKKGGHEGIACRDGVEALAAAREHGADLVLLDLVMPRLDGLATLAELKRDPATAGIPVVILTSRGESLTREELEASGAAAFLTKPFSPTALLKTIKNLINE
jgi:CheY-like chemotaxis protein